MNPVINGAPDPTLDPRAAMRIEAASQAKLWVDALKTNGLRSGLFAANTPQNDASAFWIGMIDGALWDLGYTIAALSHQITGQSQAGVFQQNLAILVRAKGDVAPRVIL